MENVKKKSFLKMDVDLLNGPIFKALVIFAIPLFISNVFQQLYNTVDTMIVGNLSLNLDNETVGINLEDATPVSENVGMSYKPYSFTLTNDGNIESIYTIYLIDDDNEIPTGTEKINDKYIRFNLIKNGIKENSKLLTDIMSDEGRILDSGTIQPGQTNNYDLRLWIDGNADYNYKGAMFAGRIEIVAEQIKE